MYKQFQDGKHQFSETPWTNLQSDIDKNLPPSSTPTMKRYNIFMIFVFQDVFYGKGFTFRALVLEWHFMDINNVSSIIDLNIFFRIVIEINLSLYFCQFYRTLCFCGFHQFFVVIFTI